MKSIEHEAIEALIEWRMEAKAVHTHDCGCILCVALGEAADRLIQDRLDSGRSPRKRARRSP